MDGVFCLAVREKTRAAMARVGGRMGAGVREHMAEARSLRVSRTDDIDNLSAGIGAILTLSSTRRRYRIAGRCSGPKLVCAFILKPKAQLAALRGCDSGTDALVCLRHRR